MLCLRIRGLTKEFRGWFTKKPIRVVDNVCLELERGKIIGLLGPNGAGKTTLLKMISGLLRPSRGEIRFWNKEGREEANYLQYLGVVLEGSRNSVWTLTVRQNLVYFGYLKNVSGKLLQKRMNELLELFNLENRKNDLVQKLSKGMKQKLAIMLALMNDPDLLLLDEPMLGLDVSTVRDIKEILSSLALLNKCIVLSTHQMKLAEELCDEIAVIKDGKLLTFEPTKKLFKQRSKDYYTIRVGALRNLKKLDDLIGGNSNVRSVRSEDSDEIKIELRAKGDAELVDFLHRLVAIGGNLLSVVKSEPNLEDVFIEMVSS